MDRTLGGLDGWNLIYMMGEVWVKFLKGLLSGTISLVFFLGVMGLFGEFIEYREVVNDYVMVWK